MPPFPAFGGPAQAPRHVIRIPTFQSPTRQRTPARAPQNRDEERQARLGRRGGTGGSGEAQWASLDQLAQAGPASLAHLLGPRKGVAPVPSAARTSGEAGEAAQAKRARRSTRGAAGRAGEDEGREGGAAAPVGSASTSSSTAPVATASSSAAAAPAAAPTRGPRIPRAALRRPGAPFLGPAVPAAAALSSAPAPAPLAAPVPPHKSNAPPLDSPPPIQSGTSAAPSLAGKAYRRPSDGARPSAAAAAAAVGPVKEKPAGKRRRVEQVDERDEATSPSSKKVKAPAAPAGRRAPRAAGVTAKAPVVLVPAAPSPHKAPVKPSTAGKKRAAIEPASPARKQPAAAPAPLRKEKKRAREETVGVNSEDEDEAVQLALVGAPSPKARKRATVHDDEDDMTIVQRKPTKRPRARPVAPAPPSPPPPSPPPPPRPKKSSRAGIPPTPAATPASASSSPPPQRQAPAKKKAASTAKHVVVVTVRKGGNTGALNALDVVVGESATAFERLLDETDDTRGKKALKLLRKRVQDPLMNCSSLISTISSTSKALVAARARARKLRDELDEAFTLMSAYAVLSSSLWSFLGYPSACTAAECSGVSSSSKAVRASPDAEAAKVNHLFRLPVELLVIIIKLVDDAGEGPYLARVSRALVPVARRLAFRKVMVTSHERLHRLVNVVRASPAVAESVVELHIDFAAWDKQDLPPTPTLLAFLRALVHLEHLSITESPSLIDLILSTPDLASVLPNLRSLDLALRTAGSSSFTVDRGARLLESDDIALDGLGVTAPTSARHIVAHSAPTVPPPLQHVSLKLPLHPDSRVASLLGTLEHVRDVGLHDMALPSPSPLHSILRLLPNPTLVTSLSLSQLAAEANPRPLADALKHFTALETLELKRGMSYVATSAALEPLERLVELRLARGLKPEPEDLRAIVRRPGTLERIVLDAIPLESHLEAVREPGRAYPWAVDDLLDLVPLAAAHGVALCGAAIERAQHERARRTRWEAERAGTVAVEDVGSSVYFSSRQCSWP
ncbi:hypothetical protein JCM8208_006042 [Rhodotorula glutinis]